MNSTEDKILSAAAAVFAEHGFKSATTREIARKAGVNLCAINYHFGTKQQLYDRVLTDVAEFISAKIKEKSSAGTETGSRAVLKKTLCDLFDLMCETERQTEKFGVVARELLSPSKSYTLFYEKVFAPVHAKISALIAAETGQNGADAVVTAHCLMGQVVMFKLHKEGLCRRLGVDGYSAELKNLIKERIAKNCDAVLDARGNR